MGRNVWLPATAVSLLVTMALAGCLSDFGTVEAPRWETGYAFSFEGSSQWTERGAFRIDGELVEEFDESEQEDFGYFLEVLDPDFVAAGQDAYFAALVPPKWLGAPSGGAASGRPQVSAIPVAVRHHDLGEMFGSIQFQAECQGEVCQVTNMDVTFRPDRDDIPFIDFPLEKGKKWGGIVGGDFLDYTISFKVRGAERVTFPLGTVDAIRVEMTVRPANAAEMLADARREMAEEGIQVDRLEYSESGRMTMWYSPDIGTVVKTTFAYEERVRVVASFDGEHIDMDFSFKGSGTEHLVGARLVEGPPRDKTSIHNVFFGLEPLVDPKGDLPPVGDRYSLALQADGTSVNAADSPTVTFTAQASRPPPQGHTITITLRDATGTVVATEEGTTLQYVVDEPGLYTAHARALDAEGRLQAAAATFLTADYEAMVPFACTPVGTSVVNALGCDEVNVPVRPGIRALEVRVAPAPTHAGSQVVLTDPTGQRITGQTYISLQEFTGYAVGAEDWHVVWNPLVQAVAEGSFQIRLDHGGLGMAQSEGGLGLAQGEGSLAPPGPHGAPPSLTEAPGLPAGAALHLRSPQEWMVAARQGATPGVSLPDWAETVLARLPAGGA